MQSNDNQPQNSNDNQPQIDGYRDFILSRRAVDLAEKAIAKIVPGTVPDADIRFLRSEVQTIRYTMETWDKNQLNNLKRR